jgi:hypothetical protein
MSIYLDRPFDDEIILSVIGRYIDEMDVRRRTAFLFGLFGGKPSFSVLCMGCLTHLAQETADCWGWGSDQIAFAITLYPYFASFLSAPSAKRLLLVCRQGTIALKSRFSKLVISPLYIRICRECHREDRLEGRPEYWRRAHQLPGVVLCVRHGIMLRMVDFHKTQRLWVTPGELRGLDQPIPIELTRTQRKNCLALASMSAELLAGRVNFVREELVREWIFVAEEAGFAYGTGRFKTDIKDVLVNFYGDEFIDFFGANSNLKFNLTRLRAHRGKDGASALHVLLWQLFFTDWLSRSPRGTWPACPGKLDGKKDEESSGLPFQTLVELAPCVCGRCVTFGMPRREGESALKNLAGK